MQDTCRAPSELENLYPRSLVVTGIPNGPERLQGGRQLQLPPTIQPVRGPC